MVAGTRAFATALLFLETIKNFDWTGVGPQISLLAGCAAEPTSVSRQSFGVGKQMSLGRRA